MGRVHKFQIIVLAAVLPLAAFAQSPCLASIEAIARPPSQPTQVDVSFIVSDVLDIDDVNQSLNGDFLLKLEWQDARLSALSGCRIERSKIWFPQIELMNSNRLTRSFTQAQDQVLIGEKGRVFYFQRYTGTASTYHELHEFPFDKQRFVFDLASLIYDDQAVQLRVGDDGARLGRRQNIVGWFIQDASAESMEVFVDPLGANRSVVRLIIDAERDRWFYVLKVLLPLAVIVGMSWTVFWIPPNRFETQLGFAATSMLTLVSFQFSFRSTVPEVSYLTKMDWLVNSATLLVFLAMMQALFTGYLDRTERAEKAIAIDKICRWLFPFALLVLWAIVIIS